jgi:predicted phosphodiesterase
MTLNEMVEADPEVYVRLMSHNASHAAVARELGINESAVRKWRRKNRPGQMVGEVGDFGPLSEEPEEAPPVTFDTVDRDMLHQKLDELLDTINTDPGSVKSLRIAAWDGMVKNNDGDPQIVRQYGIRAETARWSPSWPVVQQAAPVVIDVDPVDSYTHDGRLAVILPDTQIGYRFYQDSGEYDPFHDKKAIDVAWQITRDVKPDTLIFIGDFLDLPTFGKYEQEATFARTTQKSVDYGYSLLAAYRALLPHAKIVVLEGNHDRRLEKMVTRNAMEAFGLRRADDVSGWPVLSLPHLLRFSELGIEYVGGYPAGTYWINDRLKCIHGSVVRSAGSTAKAVVDEERTSVIFGHIHRIETQYKTTSVREGGRTRLAHTPGCLCRIDGAVPSVKGSTDLSGRPVEHFENWQQGLSVVSFEDGDGPFNIESIFINTADNYRAVYGNKVYRAW